MHLWDFVKRKVTPLGEPSPGERPIQPIRDPFFPFVDLHGLTVADAHRRVDEVIAMAAHHHEEHVTIVTGRSGIIRREFEHWVAGKAGVAGIEELNGGGAFRLRLRK